MLEQQPLPCRRQVFCNDGRCPKNGISLKEITGPVIRRNSDSSNEWNLDTHAKSVYPRRLFRCAANISCWATDSAAFKAVGPQVLYLTLRTIKEGIRCSNKPSFLCAATHVAAISFQNADHSVPNERRPVRPREHGVHALGVARVVVPSCIAVSPKPYSPASAYVLKYHPSSGSIYGTNSSDVNPLYMTLRSCPVSLSRTFAWEMTTPAQGLGFSGTPSWPSSPNGPCGEGWFSDSNTIPEVGVLRRGYPDPVAGVDDLQNLPQVEVDDGSDAPDGSHVEIRGALAGLALDSGQPPSFFSGAEQGGRERRARHVGGVDASSEDRAVEFGIAERVARGGRHVFGGVDGVARGLIGLVAGDFAGLDTGYRW
ncbi:hypothetical protein ACLOJK_005422 [Asimina triloba]